MTSTSRVLLIALLLVICCYIINITAINSDIRLDKKLNEVVFLQTHDSMTGEFDEKRDFIVEKLARTQGSSVVEQLNCGARSLDYRPYLADDSVLLAHHGPIVIHKTMKETLNEILRWGRENPSELVYISLSHCVTERFHNNYYADDCYETALQLLNEMEIHTVTNCNDLIGMTYADALRKGTIIAVWGCGYGFWDPSITCYGLKEDNTSYACYPTKRQPEENIQIPWNKLTSFLESNTEEIPPISEGNFWNIGGNWQSSVLSDTLCTFHNSTLVLDEERSGVNQYLVDSIRADKYKYLNVLGIDNICDHGLDIVTAINEVYYSSPNRRSQSSK